MILENFFQNLISSASIKSAFIISKVEVFVPWFFSNGIKVVAILFAAWLFSRFGKVFISRLIKTLIRKGGELMKDGQIQEEREKTLVNVFSSSLKIVIWVLAILMILPELGVNVTPLLAGAGLIGLAIGMGSKNLVQDYLSGLFILIEDQYRVGEEVDLGGIKGEVVELTLRKTILKDSEGVIYYVSNGQVKKVSNHSRGKQKTKK